MFCTTRLRPSGECERLGLQRAITPLLFSFQLALYDLKLQNKKAMDKYEKKAGEKLRRLRVQESALYLERQLVNLSFHESFILQARKISIQSQNTSSHLKRSLQAPMHNI
jgi:hypothetical protein